MANYLNFVAIIMKEINISLKVKFSEHICFIITYLMKHQVELEIDAVSSMTIIFGMSPNICEVLHYYVNLTNLVVFLQLHRSVQ